MIFPSAAATRRRGPSCIRLPPSLYRQLIRSQRASHRDCSSARVVGVNSDRKALPGHSKSGGTITSISTRSGCFPARPGVDLVHQIDLVCTARLTAAARRSAAPGRISRVPSRWVGHAGDRWVRGVVLPGGLARAGQRSLRSVGRFCVWLATGRRGGRVSRGGPGGSARSGHRWPSRAGRRWCGGISGSG